MVYPNRAYRNVLSTDAVFACVIVKLPVVIVDTYTVGIVDSALAVAGCRTGTLFSDTRSSVTVVVVALAVSVTVPVFDKWP